MRALAAFCVAGPALLASAAPAEAACCGCAPVYRAGPVYFAATPARVVHYRPRVIYAPAGTSPGLVAAVAQAFPPPAARVMFDLRTGRIAVKSPW